jgi:hypothetical protein
LRAACKALEVDRGRRGKAGLVIALVAIAPLTIAPAMAKPIAHHAVFLKALRKPRAASVPVGAVGSIRHYVRGPVRLQEVPGPVTDIAAERPIVSRPQASFFRSVQNA